MNIFVIGGDYLAQALRRLGAEVLCAGHQSGADLPISHPHAWKSLAARLQGAGFSPDVLLYVDNGNLPLLVNPADVPCPSIFFSIDTYCNPWQVPFGKAFDLTYVAQKDFLPLFLADGQNARWLPLFCRTGPGWEPAPAVPFLQRDIPVAFVGTIGHPNNPQRGPFLRVFRSRQPLLIRPGDFRPVFSRSRIVLNQTAFSEVNFRCFEAMAFGAALLMEKCDNGFEELFSPGRDILPAFERNDAARAAAIASDYLAMPDALAEIASSGRELALSRHSDTARAATVLADAAALSESGVAARRLASPDAARTGARTAFGMLASELDAERMQKYRDFFFSLAGG